MLKIDHSMSRKVLPLSLNLTRNLLLKTGHPVRARESVLARVPEVRSEKARRVLETVHLRRAEERTETRVRTRERDEVNPQVLTAKAREADTTLAKAKATGSFPLFISLHYTAYVVCKRYKKEQ